jgi:hypothetical protein
MTPWKLFFVPKRWSTRVIMPAAFLAEINPLAGLLLLRISRPLHLFLKRRGL